MVLKRLRVSRSPGTYILLVSYRSVDPQLAADVANGVVESYINHVYSIRYEATANLSSFLERQMEELKARMERSSAALAAFEKELDVVNPDEKTNILSARLLQLNAEYTNAQADRIRKEAAFNAVRSDSLEAAEASTQGEELRRIEEHLNAAHEKFASIQSQYGYNHPEYKKAKSELTEIERQVDVTVKNIRERVAVEYQAAVAREKMMKKNVEATKAEFDRINARSFEYKALKDEADSDKTLYQQLIKKIREERVNASFQNSSIRLADRARPALKAIFPNVTLNSLLAFMCASIVAMAVAIMADVLSDKLQDPREIQRSLGIDVVGSLPLVRGWRGRQFLLGTAKAGTTGKRRRSPQAIEFEEAIRTLRDSVLVPGSEKRIRSLVVSSATQREGKSMVAAQLAIAHSRQKRRTLIIDGDMRRASVHRYLGGLNEHGLSNVVNGELNWRDVVRTHESLPSLSMITAGTECTQAVECVGPVLSDLLQEAMEEYDLVIVDTPPMAFAETLQMAAVVQGVLLVALHGETNRTALANAVSDIRRMNPNIVGLALNEIDVSMREHYYYGYYARHNYKALNPQTES